MDSASIDRIVLEVALAQRGAVAAAQLHARGVNDGHIHRRVSKGMLRTVRRGLYLLAGAPASWEQDLWLAHLDLGAGSAVNGWAAAQLHGLPRFRGGAVEVLTTSSSHHRPVRGRAHETFWLPQEHVIRFDGLPTTTLARTVFDLAGLPKYPLAFRDERLRGIHTQWTTSIINAAIRDHGLRMSDLCAVLAAVGRRGKPGTAIIRAIVGDLGRDYRPSDSELEAIFLALVRSVGLPEPDPQVNLGTKQRWVGRVDFLFRAYRLVVECDGRTHDAPLEVRADRARDEQLATAGYTVIRFTWWQLVHEPEACVRELRQALRLAA